MGVDFLIVMLTSILVCMASRPPLGIFRSQSVHHLNGYSKHAA